MPDTSPEEREGTRAIRELDAVLVRGTVIAPPREGHLFVEFVQRNGEGVVRLIPVDAIEEVREPASALDPPPDTEETGGDDE